MPDPNQMNLSFSTNPGEPSLNRLIRESQGAARDGKKRVPRLSATLQRVVKWIKEQEYDEFTEQELIKVAQTYPAGALPRFKMVAKNHLARIQEKKRQIDRQKVVKKQELDMDALKREEQDKIREYRILRNQQKQEEEAAALAEKEESLRNLASQAQELPNQFVQKPIPQPQWQEPVQQTPVAQPQMPTKGKVEFPEGPPPSQRTPEEVRQAMENRQAFAKRMKELAAQEDDGLAADEEWMN